MNSVPKQRTSRMNTNLMSDMGIFMVYKKLNSLHYIFCFNYVNIRKKYLVVGEPITEFTYNFIV